MRSPNFQISYIRSLRLSVRTQDFHSCKSSSILLESTLNFQDMLEYRKVYDYITESWVWEPYETDPCRVEYSTPGEAKLKAIGMYKGMKPKSWNELTPEEKALFEEKKPRILGAVVGDICGSIYEFNNVKTTNFELLDGRNRPTDDTIMTLAIADWLVEDPTHSSEFLIENMVTLGRNYIGCGFGGMFRRWIVSDKHTPYNSFGNGSAMRVSPVGLYAKTLKEALDLAKRSAEVTHNHPEGIKGAQAVADKIPIKITFLKVKTEIFKT